MFSVSTPFSRTWLPSSLRMALLTLLAARVLDEKLKRENNAKLHPGMASARKRARHSNT